jgi:micrococcal nuclease
MMMGGVGLGSNWQVMRQLFRNGLLVALALLVLGAASGERVRVLWVVDGDTVGISYRGQWEKVRLLRVNTPERGQPGYAASAEFLRNLVAGKTVTLDFEERGDPERDTYGRLLAYLHLRGDNVNVEIVRAGWSPFWTKYGAGKYADEFREAETEALNAFRGLWAIAPKGTTADSIKHGWCASRNSKVYHPCSCPSVKRIKAKNLI